MNFFYDLIYCLTVTGLAASILSPFVSLPERIIFVVLAGIFYCAFFTGLKNAPGKYRILILGIVLVPFLSIVFFVKKDNLKEFFAANIWLLWLLIIAVSAFLLTFIMGKSVWIKRVVGVLTLMGAIVYLFMGYSVLKAAPAFFFLFMLLIISEEVQRRWVKSGDTNVRPHTVLISPFLILACVLVFLMPAPERAYDWNFAVNIYNSVLSKIDRINFTFIKGKDSFGVMGFSDENVFNAAIGRRDRELIKVTSSRGNENMYLAGVIFDDFTGKNWESTITSDAPVHMLDTLELRAAVNQTDHEIVTDYVKEVGISVEYIDFYTHYFFVPAKSILSNNKLSTLEFTEDPASIGSVERLGKNTSYTVTSLKLNKDSWIFKDLIENAEPVRSDSWGRMTQKYAVDAEEGFSYEDYLDYKKNMIPLYTEDITLSPGVRDILDTLFEGAASDYEKMLRLEEWFKTLSYSTAPGDLPEDIDSAEDYLDWFLLNKRVGFCTHYATAFALIARAEGLPSRYVQGYHVKTEKDGLASIKGSDAHSWPEVYFENVGWIPFEPTPGFYYPKGWYVADPEAVAAAASDEEKEETPPAEKEYIADIAPIEEPEEEEPLDIRLVLLPLLGTLGFVILYLVISRIISKVKFSKLDTDEKTRFLSRRNLKIMSVLGNPVNRGETLSEYNERMSGDYPKEALKFIANYERLLYSESEADKDDLDDAFSGNKVLLDILTKKRFIYRLFMW